MSRDIFECNKCHYQGLYDGPKCPECKSDDVVLIMRAPSKEVLRAANLDSKEDSVAELDPEWKDRFHGDVDLAYDFYFRS